MYPAVYGNNLGSEGGKALVEALCKNNTVTFLNLEASQLGFETGKALAETFFKNITLTTLIFKESTVVDFAVKKEKIC